MDLNIAFGILLCKMDMVQSVGFVPINLRRALQFQGSNGIWQELMGKVLRYVKKCLMVSKKLRQAIACKNERRKTKPSSRNNELNNAISTSIREQSNGAENRGTDVEIMETQVQGIDGEQWQWRASSLAEASNHIESIIREPIQPAEMVRFLEGLVLDAHEISGDALLTTKLVVKACEGYMDQIRSGLMEEDVQSIGIYGMGGVGKTVWAKHIPNDLRRRVGLLHGRTRARNKILF